MVAANPVGKIVVRVKKKSAKNKTAQLFDEDTALA
jgi:hypothetical protein